MPNGRKERLDRENLRLDRHNCRHFRLFGGPDGSAWQVAVRVLRVARRLALEIGFSSFDATAVATAAAEFMRRFCRLSQQGWVTVGRLDLGDRVAIRFGIWAGDGRDWGHDLEIAVRPELGNLVDDIEVEASDAGAGIRFTKWVRGPHHAADGCPPRNRQDDVPALVEFG